MRRKGWVAVIVAIVIIGAVVFLAQRKPVKNGIATFEPQDRRDARPTEMGFAMTAADISAAINYGKTHKDDLLIDFEKPWTVFMGYGNGKGSATIFTPYHCLSLMARNSVKDNSNMDTEVLYRLCAENHKDLYFEVTLYNDNYGNDDFFDRDYKTVILKDGREIPILKTFHQGYDQAREYTISSQQKLYFPVDMLQENGNITLRIVKPKETPLDFVFDLKRIP